MKEFITRGTDGAGAAQRHRGCEKSPAREWVDALRFVCIVAVLVGRTSGKRKWNKLAWVAGGCLGRLGQTHALHCASSWMIGNAEKPSLAGVPRRGAQGNVKCRGWIFWPSRGGQNDSRGTYKVVYLTLVYVLFVIHFEYSG